MLVPVVLGCSVSPCSYPKVVVKSRIGVNDRGLCSCFPNSMFACHPEVLLFLVDKKD